MHATRRRFLQTTFGSSTLLAAGLDVPGFLARTARAADTGKSTGERILVVVQLSGGNDGLNTVIPYADDAYARNRIVLRIPRDQVRKIDDHVGLHPRLEGFEKLLAARRLAIVQGVGYPNPDRSHFRSMDIWHSAQPKIETPRDGWLGRALETSVAGGRKAEDVAALHIGPQKLPLALASRTVAVPSVDSLENFRLRSADGGAVPAAFQQLAAAERRAPTPALEFLQRAALNAYASSAQVQAALVDERSPVKYPPHGLANKLKNVAQLIDAGLRTRIYYVSLDGFDTHAKQAQAHAALLGELADSVQAFVDDLAHRGHLDRVVVLSFSEFGRRVRENASQGTDHGTAAPLFLAGNKVAAGVVGQQPSLADLDGEGDLKFHTDFRGVYAAILDRWLGLESATILGEKFPPLNVFTA